MSTCRDFLLLHLTRSGQSPIRLRLGVLQFQEGVAKRELSALYALLSDYSSRIRRLEIDSLPVDALQEMGLVQSSGSTISSETILESLSFGVLRAGGIEIQLLADLVRHTTFPHLKAFSVRFFAPATAFTREWTFPYSQLQNLSFQVSVLSDLPHILSSCSQIRSLNVRLIGGGFESAPGESFWYPARDVITFPNLTLLTFSIHISDWGYEAMRKAVGLLHCPCLISFALISSSTQYRAHELESAEHFAALTDDFFNTIISFVSERSRCTETLTSLRLDGVRTTDRSLTHLLRLLTSLRHFSFRGAEIPESNPRSRLIQGVFFNDFLWTGIDYDPHPNSFLPALRSLKLELSGGWCRSEELRTMEAVILSRITDREGVAGLESVFLEMPEDAVQEEKALAGLIEAQQNDDVAIKVFGHRTQKVLVDCFPEFASEHNGTVSATA
ncbi:hypothetical protein AAF712_007680 [Marasmius tenuissimus]|uniref:Uncharacterized protein n=1 Tax=Marasmius tenuissimus TaxID=585030 RepID=A0ABR2ZYG3_9AGAR|nr:hypothetical protein PM082_024701 [Marasmius tenuissimus]